MPKNFEMLTKLSQTENWKEQVVYNLEGVRPDQKSVEKNRQKTKSMLRLQEDSR